MNEKLDKLAPGVPGKITFVIDLALVALSLVMAALWADPFTEARLIALVAIGVLTWTVASTVTRLYSPWTPRRLLDSVMLALIATFTLTVVVWGADQIFFAPPDHFQPAVFLGVMGGFVVSTQVLVFRPLHRSAAPVDDVLIIGTGALGIATHQYLTTKGGARRNVIGFLKFADDPALPARVDAPILGNVEDLYTLLEKRTVAEVYLAERVMNHGKEMQTAVKLMEEIGVPFAIPLHSLRYNRARLLSSAKKGDGYLHYLNTDSKALEWAVKRLLDIILSACALVALSPLLLGVAAIIKLTDGGPALFRQTRVGLHGAHFSFLKFRSMVVNADAMKDKLLHLNEQTGPVFKMKNDPRITTIGRFIRKFSVDELPQLINVLRGDMTIVGPRPPVPREVALYKPWQRRRLSVRPGLTCYWQVGGRNEIGFDEWMLLDLRYVDNWSLAKDFQLIAKTVPVVLLGKGAS